jgi:hypothetical protein
VAIKLRAFVHMFQEGGEDATHHPSRLACRSHAKVSARDETCKCECHEILEVARLLLIGSRTKEGCWGRLYVKGARRKEKSHIAWPFPLIHNWVFNILALRISLLITYPAKPPFTKNFHAQILLFDHAEEGRLDHASLPQEEQRQLSI